MSKPAGLQCPQGPLAPLSHPASSSTTSWVSWTSLLPSPGPPALFIPADFAPSTCPTSGTEQEGQDSPGCGKETLGMTLDWG